MSQNCCVCHNNNLKCIYSKNGTHLYQCKKCGIIFANGITYDDDKSFNVNWKMREKGLKKLRIKNFKKILNKMKQYIPNSAVGLEVGSAYGDYLELANKNYICYGIEPDVKNISCKGNFTVYEGFFPVDLPSTIKDLDFIIFNDVFEHIPNCYDAMNQCYKLLKNDGFLIINLPLSTGFFYRMSYLLHFFHLDSDFERMWQFQTNSPHLYYFNKKNLIALAHKCGLSFISFDTLDVLEKDTIYERVSTMNTKHEKRKGKIISMLYPFLSFLPKDIGVFIFQKKS